MHPNDIGRYVIHTHIADGGMASVYKAYDPYLNRFVAIKVIKTELLSHPETFSAMFEQEASMMARLEHPNILPVYDYGYVDNMPYYVVRLVEDGTLEDLLKGGKLAPLSVVKLVERLASAIDYFHSRNVIHRDLKPANILISQRSHPYISDFGLTSVAQSLVEQNVTAGSPFYMAPEQWMNKLDNPRSDLFALGIVVFQAFTGHYPIPEGFDPDSAVSIKQFRLSSRNKALPSIRRYLPELPIGVEVVLNRLTRFDPNERYSSATEAADALVQAFFSGQSNISGRVFISYSRKDSAYVYELAKQLIDVGVEIWIDRDIAPGRHWDRNIEEALNDCESMIVVLSPDSVASENVQDEWSYYLEQRKNVYPFVLRNCNIPFRLRRKQYVVSNNDVFLDASQLVDVLAGGTPTRLSSIDAIYQENGLMIKPARSAVPRLSILGSIFGLFRGKAERSPSEMNKAQFRTASTEMFISSPRSDMKKAQFRTISTDLYTGD